MRLTDEQRDIVMKNRKLVGGYLRDSGLSEEWTGLLYESLIKSVINYDEDRGKLSTLFYTVARHDVIREASKKQDYVMRADCLSNSYTLKSANDFSYEEFVDGLSIRQRKIVDMIAEGYKKYEIAEHLGVANSTISYEVNKMKDILL